MSSVISLIEWIERALEAATIPSLANESFASSFGPYCNDWPAGIRRALAISSDSYLESALRVARSLADQLGGADENNSGHQSLSPTPGTSWADQIFVHLSNEHQSIDYTNDLEPLTFSWKNPSSDPKESQDSLNSIIPDHSLYTRKDAEEDGENKVNISPYHNIARAEFSPSLNDNLGSQKVDMQRIYNLGIVFYVLFSGGERPPESKDQISSAESTNKSGDDKADVDEEPLPHNLAGALVLSGRLSIFDEVCSIGNLLKNSDVSRQQLDITEDMLIPHKKRSTPGSCTLSSIIFEPLRRKGVPVSLCNMVVNMIDSMNGNLSGDEAYSTMSDVRSDLQLMLDKPDRFLYDMDCEKFAVTGLQLHEAVIGREIDFSALKNSYRRSILGENECGLIVGPSGIGKTVLANQLGSFASAEGALFLKGKFDQLQQMTPFSALASAFNDYCFQMFKEGGYRYLQQVASKLKLALGEEARHLVKVIPNLSNFLGEGADHNEGEDCANAQARIQHLLCLFVDVISSSSGAPIVLFLDDLQWCDRASINAINQLLMFFRPFDPKRRFFFLGSCREEGLHEQHSFGSMLASIRQYGVHTTLVKLACLDKDATNTVVSDLLCLSPRLTRTLSDIVYHKSQGNPFLFSQLMISLCRDGLVRLCLSRRRWEWDEEKIQSIKVPDNVADVLSSTIERLPEEVQGALRTLSCFGARSDCVLIEALEAKLDILLIEPLQVAVSEGIIDKFDGSFSFAHDKLQEAAYNLMQPEDRCLFHCKYGLALVHHELEVTDDTMLFTAVRQINLGGPSAINNTAQAVQIAKLNLTAGIKAIGMSDFSSAFSFFDHGISYLPKNHWQEHYDLSLQLYEAACICALVLGDAVSLKLVSDHIFKYAKRFEDKLNTMFSNVTALAYTFQLPESVKFAISVLSQLGIKLPESLESDFKAHIEQTKVLLQGYTEYDLLEFKIMTDQSKKAAMKFLARLLMSLQMIRPAAAPIITLNMIQLSINNGMSPVSPIGFAYFGQHIATCGDIQEGCRYVNIARQMLVRLGSKEFAGEVIATGSQLLHFVKPIQVTLELHTEGYTIAMSVGDTQSAMLNSMYYSGIAFYTGTLLNVCKENFSRTCRLMEQHGHINLLAVTIQLEKNVQLLIGNNDGHSERPRSKALLAQIEEIRKNANHQGSISFYLQMMYIHFMFREHDDMKIFAEQFIGANANYHNYMLHFPLAIGTFYGGLAAFWVYRQTNDPSWASRGRTATASMKKWAKLSQHNFLHKLYLLEAEEAFSNNDTNHAHVLYAKAVSAAKEHRFINEEALSSELAGYYFLAIDKKDAALQNFLHAHEKYHDWGAVAKRDALFEFILAAFDSESIIVGSASSTIAHGARANRNPRKNKWVPEWL